MAEGIADVCMVVVVEGGAQVLKDRGRKVGGLHCTQTKESQGELPLCVKQTLAHAC